MLKKIFLVVTLVIYFISDSSSATACKENGMARTLQIGAIAALIALCTHTSDGSMLMLPAPTDFPALPATVSNQATVCPVSQSSFLALPQFALGSKEPFQSQVKVCLKDVLGSYNPGSKGYLLLDMTYRS